jgi:hypothetical protein
MRDAPCDPRAVDSTIGLPGIKSLDIRQPDIDEDCMRVGGRPFRSNLDSQFDSHGLGQVRMKRTNEDCAAYDSSRFGRGRIRFKGT